MDPGTGRYEEVFERAAWKRFDKAVVRFLWREWALYALVQSYRFAFACLIAIAVYGWVSQRGFDAAACLAGMLAGTALGVFTATGKALEDAQHGGERQQGTVLLCELTDEGFSQENAGGTKAFHPWGTLSLLFEHPDGYLVDTANGTIAIDRRALAAASLEDLFLARIGIADRSG